MVCLKLSHFVLVIRGLELHRHYERLLPKNMENSVNESSEIKSQLYNDFLVVHPYNLKA
jgi:hypothetical protein